MLECAELGNETVPKVNVERRTKARPIAFIAVAMIVLAASAAAEKPRVTHEFVTELASRIGSRVERFSLWNDCGPLRSEAHLRSDSDKLPEGNPLFGLTSICTDSRTLMWCPMSKTGFARHICPVRVESQLVYSCTSM